jgi:hypothetical protein
VPLLVNRSSGSSVRLPIWTVKLSLLTAGLQTVLWRTVGSGG